MSKETKHSWYVIQTKPMEEDRVCRQFSRGVIINPTMPNEGIVADVEAFCPKIKCMSAGKKSADGVKYRPLFPSYIFLRWDLNDPANHHTVKYTRGVNKVLGEGAKAVSVPDEIIEIIKERTNEVGIIEQQTFKVGEPVKVKRGHLKELIGILERPVSDSGRVAVLLNLFNRQMRVHLSCADIVAA